MKTSDWIVYKDENWNVYKIYGEIVILHPETDSGFSKGSLISVPLSCFYN